MATINVNRTTIHYERSGQGPAILFVHGLFGDADVWADQAQRLGDRCTCVRYDRRGYTRSTRGDGAIDYRVHADDAAALIERLGLAPCLLVGSSAGAAIGVDVARRHGHLLRGVVLSEPPLFSLDPEMAAAAQADLGPVIREAMTAGDPRAAVDAFMQLVCPGLWQNIDEIRRQAYRANADIGFTDMSAPPLDITAGDLAGVTVPALVIAGETSHRWLRSIAHTLAAGLPDVRFVELEGSGHVTYAERPVEFAAAIAAFIDEFDRRPARFDVRSADGTPIAVWVTGGGGGVPLVLVHGTLNNHSGFDQLIAELGDGVTTFAVDRRGYGASGDSDEYQVERDFEDLAAVIDAVTARTGRTVAVLGHSYGANCAMGAALRTTNLSHLMLYEGSLGLDYPPGAIDAMEAALASGDRETVLLAVLAPLELTEQQIGEMRAGPRWPVLLAGAANGPRECRAEQSWRAGYELFASIAAPTLLLTGDESPPDVEKLTNEAAAAIPGAQLRVLHGHAHFAHRTDPALIASIIREFISAGATPGPRWLSDSPFESRSEA